MLLKDKTAVIYGAGGAVGGAIARGFAREGARIFLAGRTLAPLDAVAKDIRSEGGEAETASVDAMDAESVERHLAEVVRTAGRLDISFNLVGLEDVQGIPFVELEPDLFTRPIVRAVTTQYLTGTAAARQMAKQGSGVILALTAQVARRAASGAGGFGVAGAAIEGFCRQLAAEVGPQGVRVVCLRSAGSPESPGLDEVLRDIAQKAGITREQIEASMAESTMLKRLPKLVEVANAAALMASDYASAVTAEITNLTCGELAD
ncbi:MAG TPA: SDR family oxidoreductase [Ktedonobacterales bacterium]